MSFSITNSMSSKRSKTDRYHQGKGLRALPFLRSFDVFDNCFILHTLGKGLCGLIFQESIVKRKGNLRVETTVFVTPWCVADVPFFSASDVQLRPRL